MTGHQLIGGYATPLTLLCPGGAKGRTGTRDPKDETFRFR